MTIPVIYAVARSYPNDAFTVLTRKPFDELFLERPCNVEVITDKAWKHMHFTHIADLHNVLRSWRIDARMLIRGKRVCMLDKRRSERSNIVKGKRSSRPFIDRYIDVFSRLGFPIDNTEQPFVLSPNAPKNKVVGIAPFARYDNKTYPIEKMKTVAKMLSAEGCTLYLYGARGKEAGILKQWAEEIPQCTCVAGQYALKDEPESMRHLDLMIAMDSANGHIAAMAGTRVLTIWGSTTPACGFRAFRQSDEDQVFIGLPCQPCTIAGSEACKLGTMACLCELTPEVIVERVLEIVNEPS